MRSKNKIIMANKNKTEEQFAQVEQAFDLKVVKTAKQQNEEAEANLPSGD